VLTSLQEEQQAQRQIATRGVRALLPARAAVQATRDSALRALLVDQSARAEFDRRRAPMSMGRRGAPPPVSDGRSRVAVGRGQGPGVSTAAFASGTDATLQYLLGGLGLTSDQETRARGIIASAQNEEARLIPVPPVVLGVHTAVDGATQIVLPAESRAVLLGLVGTEEDRALVRSRIIVARATRAGLP
jgi:hypothetical protein